MNKKNGKKKSIDSILKLQTFNQLERFFTKIPHFIICEVLVIQLGHVHWKEGKLISIFYPWDSMGK